MITCIFNHHKTFEAAKTDWDRRKKRIYLNKILVIIGVNDYDLIYSSKYKEIIYPKLMICNKKIDNDETIYESKYMNIEKYPLRSSILGFSNIFGKRRFDFLPYVRMIKEIINKNEKTL